MPQSQPDEAFDPDEDTADWHQRVVQRSLRAAKKRSIDRSASLIRAAAHLLERSNGDGFTVQDVADEAGQSLRTLYQYFESKDDLLLAVFEEAMRTYASLLREAIDDLTDPLERLGGALLAAVRMSELSGTGVDRGLARLRLKLTEVQPELVARSQEPVTTLVRSLVAAAADAEQIRTSDVEAATYMVLALKSAYVTNRTLGNDSAVRMPSESGITSFCLEGLGASIDDKWLDAVDARLRLPDRIGPSGSGGGRSSPKRKPASPS